MKETMKKVLTKNQPAQTYFTQREANLNIVEQMFVSELIPFSWVCNLDEFGYVSEVVMYPTSHKESPYFWIADRLAIEDEDGQVLMEDVDLSNLVESYLDCQ